MATLEAALIQAGYRALNVGYPSRSNSISRLSEETISAALAECRRTNLGAGRERESERIHFVTHSMGGILVRDYLSRHSIPELGRVVMLGPPNQGSEVVDRLGRWGLFRLINGPAGSELGTGPESTPLRLGAVEFPLGVIAGNRSINWINSLLIPGVDDGKVSVERTKVAGMSDHLVVPVSHPFLASRRVVIQQVLQFLRTGAFEH
jgi:pimeloyl-ACP methyl ester carboxylesterase